MVQEQGRVANRNGKWLEQEVENTITSYGVEKIFHAKIGTKFGQKIMASDPDAFLLKNVPYINIYGRKSFGEFVLQLKNRGPVRIECRSQKVAGSVDEKMPYLIGNCIAFEERDVIVVLEGNGMRKAAKQFLINSAKAVAYKNIKIMTLNQFKAWAKTMLGDVNENRGINLLNEDHIS